MRSQVEKTAAFRAPHERPVRGLQAYEAAGAYAPGLRSIVVTGWLAPDITLKQLSDAGAKRVSVGGALSRLALATFVKASRAMRQQVSFDRMRDMLSMAELRDML